MASYTVTEVALAARCPRQLWLYRERYRVGLLGEAEGGIGRTAHELARLLCERARQDLGLLRLLASAAPDDDELRRRLYGLVYPTLFQRALALLPSHSAGELARLDGVVRSLVGLVAALLSRARQSGVPAAAVAQRVLLGSERRVALDLGDAQVSGQIDLICEDVAQRRRWLWELKTFPSDCADPAGAVQVRLYAHLLGEGADPALLHVTGDRIEHVSQPPMGRDELRQRLQQMDAWLSGDAVPAPAQSPELCQRCSVQGACWARWGRTLAPGAAAATPIPVTAAAPVTASADPGALLQDELVPGELADGGGPLRLPAPVLCKHVCALGASGSGKTWLAKVLAEEAILCGVPVLAFDVQGDLARLLQMHDEAALPKELRERRRRFAARVEPRVWTPASGAGRRLSLSPLWLPDPSLPEEQLVLCADVIAAAVLELAPVPASWRRAGQQAVADEVVAAARAGRTLDFPGLADRVRLRADLRPTERQRLSREIDLLSRGRNQFLYATGETPRIERFLQPETPGRVPLNIVFLNVSVGLEVRQRVVAALLSQVYAWMQRTPGTPGAAGADLRPRLLLLLDEVGPYMPPVKEPPSKAVLRALFKEGRKYGVCGLFCTQNVSDVDYKVLGQANTKFVGRAGRSRRCAW